MRRLELDFIKRPSPLRYIGFVLLLIALMLSAYLAHVYFKRTAELASWEARWHSLENPQKRTAPMMPHQGPEWERMQTELKLANQVIGHLAMPWDSLFHGVESSMDGQVSLLSIEPDTEKRELRITAEAKNLQDMLGYIARLRTIQSFKDAHIVNHQIQQADPQRPVRFEINAQWDEQAPIENMSNGRKFSENKAPQIPKLVNAPDEMPNLKLNLEKNFSR